MPVFVAFVALVALDTVPVTFPPVMLVKLAPLTAPKDPDQVPEVTVPVVVKLDEPARGEAPIVLYEIVRATEPLKVVPEASPAPPLLNVTELGKETAAYAKAEPSHPKYVPLVVGATINDVVPAAVLYGILLAAPPATLVAVVALVAAPLRVAVIVPAAKLPEASRATTLEAVLTSVASTANVRAAEPSNVPALVR
jgi:hypothetical protein